MKIIKFFLAFSFYLAAYLLNGQVTLTADGQGNTYERINNVLAPNGGDVVESPGITGSTCDNHSTFSGEDNTNRHISEVFDNELNKNVFKFILHVNEDIDRDKCNTTDRQRNEIKTYAPSPDNLKGTIGETVQYKWKFKLDANFQPSSSFTHLHQIKAVGGPEQGLPTITLTPRKKSSGDVLELRHSVALSQTTETTVPLSLLKGKWVEVTETITYGEVDTSAYTIVITDITSGVDILNYTDNTLRMWKTDADFIRPKWGIYRSLNNATDLRDEEVLFADFSIEENPTLSVPSLSENNLLRMFPNPTSGIIHFQVLENTVNYTALIIDQNGRTIKETNGSQINNSIDISHLSNGFYFLKFIDNKKNTFSIKKIIKTN